MTEQEFARKYLLKDIVRRNLKFWWLLLLCAIVVAAGLGYRKYTDYQERFYKMSLKGSVDTYTMDYYTGNVVGNSIFERVNTLTDVMKSKEAYNNFVSVSGYKISYDTFSEIVRFDNAETSDILSIVLTFPWGNGDFEIIEDSKAKEFVSYYTKAMQETCDSVMKDNSAVLVGVSDKGTFDYNATEADYNTATKAIIKNVFIGFVIGLILPVVFITLIYLLEGTAKTAPAIAYSLGAKLLADIKKGNYDVLNTLVPYFDFKRNNGVMKINFINIAEENDSVMKEFADRMTASGHKVCIDGASEEGCEYIMYCTNTKDDTSDAYAKSLECESTVIVAPTGKLKEDRIEEIARTLSLYDITTDGVIVYEPAK